MNTGKENIGTGSVDVIRDAISAMHDMPVIRQKLCYILDRMNGRNTVNVLDDSLYDETIQWFLDKIISIVNKNGIPNIPDECVMCQYESLGMCYFDKDSVKNCTRIDRCPKPEPK